MNAISNGGSSASSRPEVGGEALGSDVNVGGPDGDPPECTVGTVIVSYNGGDSRRWLWDELDAVRRRYALTWGGNYPLERCKSAEFALERPSRAAEDTSHCFCWANCEEPCCWCRDDSEGEGEQAICPGAAARGEGGDR